ncbi:hypothetical protein IGJ41_002751 [Enterococcus sp. DIV1537a]|uniref:DUF2177 family protein n=1 Tax=Enterococcus sp. DIV1537a TaxID=2774733 RepID=UPI003F20FF77
MGEVRIFPAIIFYVIYVVGVTVFVLIPGIERNHLGYLLLSGAFFGFVCYATYDLTNLATLKNWPVSMTVIDLIWGIFVTMATVGIVYFINLNFFEGLGI